MRTYIGREEAVHLRLRGEHAAQAAAGDSVFGSPPPARRALSMETSSCA